MKNNFYCTVAYPVSVTLDSILQIKGITKKQFQNYTEDEKRDAVFDVADYLLDSGSVSPVIIDCVESQLND